MNNGARPPIVLVHGVGFGPETLAPLEHALQAAGATTIVMARRGYGANAERAPPPTVDDHVDDLLELLDAAELDRAVLAGISGGATIVLATTLAHPERVLTAIAHEPIAGSVSPELQSIVRAALAGGGGRALARTLAGERTFAALDRGAVRALERSIPLIEADAPAFVEYEPELRPDLEQLILATGERSIPLRMTIARRIAHATGAPIEVVPACGHLPQLDAPVAFAHTVLNHASNRREHVT